MIVRVYTHSGRTIASVHPDTATWEHGLPSDDEVRAEVQALLGRRVVVTCATVPWNPRTERRYVVTDAPPAKPVKPEAPRGRRRVRCQCGKGGLVSVMERSCLDGPWLCAACDERATFAGNRA